MPILPKLPASHKGSWLGLPDFGITERLTGTRTAQGGSNIWGSSKAAAPTQQTSVKAQMYVPDYSRPAGPHIWLHNSIPTRNNGETIDRKSNKVFIF